MFDLYMKILYWDYKIFIEKSVKSTLQFFFQDLGHFDRFEKEDDFFRNHLTFNKRRGAECGFANDSQSKYLK